MPTKYGDWRHRWTAAVLLAVVAATAMQHACEGRPAPSAVRRFVLAWWPGLLKQFQELKRHRAAVRAYYRKLDGQAPGPRLRGAELQRYLRAAWICNLEWLRVAVGGLPLRHRGALVNLASQGEYPGAFSSWAAAVLYIAGCGQKFALKSFVQPRSSGYPSGLSLFAQVRDPSFPHIAAAVIGGAKAEQAEGDTPANGAILGMLGSHLESVPFIGVMVFQRCSGREIRDAIKIAEWGLKYGPKPSFQHPLGSRRASLYIELGARVKVKRWLLLRWIKHGRLAAIGDVADSARGGYPSLIRFLKRHAKLFRGDPFAYDDMIEDVAAERRAVAELLAGKRAAVHRPAAGTRRVAFRFTTGHAVSAQGARFAKEIFPFKNTTGQMVHISKITTSCSCTAARASSKLIKPGGRGEIIATVRLKGLPPHFVRYITVYETIGSGPLPVHQKLKLLVTITQR